MPAASRPPPRTSREILRMRLRVTAVPAARPNARISRPCPLGARTPQRVHAPPVTRTPYRRRRLAGVEAPPFRIQWAYGVRRCRPFARRRLRTFRPFAVLMRLRKP